MENDSAGVLPPVPPEHQSSIRKWERGFHLREGLIRRINAWYEAGGWTITSGPSTQYPHSKGEVRNLVQITLLQEFPTDLDFLVGDALKAYQECLDHIVYELSIKLQGGLDQRQRAQIAFPYEELNNANARRNLDRRLGFISPSERRVIENCQPYNFPDLHHSPLWHLNFLTNADKHRTVTRIGPLPSADGITVDGELTRVMEVFQTDSHLELGVPRPWIAYANVDNPRLDIIGGVGPIFDVEGQPQPLGVIAFLRHIHQYIFRMILGPLVFQLEPWPFE